MITATGSRVSQSNASRAKARKMDKGCWIPACLWAMHIRTQEERRADLKMVHTSWMSHKWEASQWRMGYLYNTSSIRGLWSWRTRCSCAFMGVHAAYIYACNGMWQHLLNAPLSLATKFVCLKKNAGVFFSKFWDCPFCSSHNYLFEHETAINLPTPAQ